MSDPIPAYILAGGKSSRFGSDKARATVGADGRPLIRRIADALGPSAQPIAIAEREGKYLDLGLETIGDVNPGLGPMAGLQTALHHCKQPWLLLLSCDLLRLRPEWITQLASARREDLDIVAYRDRYWEPLCALYNARLRSDVDRRIHDRSLAMQSLLDSARTEPLVRPAEWAQANTPEDLLSNMFTVLVFGPVAKAIGTSEIRVASSTPAVTGSELREQIGAQYPAISRLLQSCRFAVNSAFVPDSAELKVNDEIALIGFVSGG